MILFLIIFFFFKQKTAYEMRISDWSSDVCSSDLSKMPGMDMSNMPGMDHSKMPGMNHGGTADSSPSTDGVVTGSNYAPGSGLAPQAPQGERVLVYGDLKSVKPYAEYRAPDREIGRAHV